jgi:Xaa-Pro aminopeptidase
MTAIYPAQRQLATFSVDDLASSLGFAQIGRSERELAEALRAAFASTSGPSFTPAHAVHTVSVSGPTACSLIGVLTDVSPPPNSLPRPPRH